MTELICRCFHDYDHYKITTDCPAHSNASSVSYLRAQLAEAQERVGEFEKHRDHEANIMDCLVADIAQRDAEIARLTEAIQNCLQWAAGRQGEWGGRATDAFAFLEAANVPYRRLSNDELGKARDAAIKAAGEKGTTE